MKITNPHSLMMTRKRRVHDDRVLLNFTNENIAVTYLVEVYNIMYYIIAYYA